MSDNNSYSYRDIQKKLAKPFKSVWKKGRSFYRLLVETRENEKKEKPIISTPNNFTHVNKLTNDTANNAINVGKSEIEEIQQSKSRFQEIIEPKKHILVTTTTTIIEVTEKKQNPFLEEKSTNEKSSHTTSHTEKVALSSQETNTSDLGEEGKLWLAYQEKYGKKDQESS